MSEEASDQKQQKKRIKRKDIVFDSYFSYFVGSEDFYLPVNSVVDNIPDYLRPIAEAFRNNLHAIIDTLTMPIVMTLTAVQSARYEKLVLSNHFRLLAEEADASMSESELLEEAHKRAQMQLETESRIEEHVIAGTESAQDRLEASLHSEQMRIAAAELLRQGVILTWAALEVLMTDVFTATLNKFPELTVKLLEDVQTRKWFQVRDPFANLQAHSYDLSCHMGDVLAEARRIDDVTTFRGVSDVLFNSSQGLLALLKDSKLWLLHQKRNLLLHRRGIVDDQYLKNTGDVIAQKGSALTISTVYVKDSLVYVRDLGRALLQSAGTLG